MGSFEKRAPGNEVEPTSEPQEQHEYSTVWKRALLKTVVILWFHFVLHKPTQKLVALGAVGAS